MRVRYRALEWEGFALAGLHHAAIVKHGGIRTIDDIHANERHAIGTRVVSLPGGFTVPAGQMPGELRRSVFGATTEAIGTVKSLMRERNASCRVSASAAALLALGGISSTLSQYTDAWSNTCTSLVWMASRDYTKRWLHVITSRS
jgi:hypothetical protein